MKQAYIKKIKAQVKELSKSKVLEDNIAILEAIAETATKGKLEAETWRIRPYPMARLQLCL